VMTPDTLVPDWTAEISSALHELVPAPLTFVLAIYNPGHPAGAALLTPQPPADVVPVLRVLADTIEDQTNG
jgi:hypothetical protein